MLFSASPAHQRDRSIDGLPAHRTDVSAHRTDVSALRSLGPGPL
jgi:hypothetical protein